MIIKLKNVFPIKDINSILKINKKSVFTSLLMMVVIKMVDKYKNNFLD